MPSISNLPEELLELILSYVSPYNDLKSCSLVCSRWYDCCRRVKQKWRNKFHHAITTGPVAFTSIPYDPMESPSSCFSGSRFLHSACILGSHMFVFGGCTFSHTTFNDLWKIDLRTKKKSRVLTSGNYPSPKCHASMVVWRDSLVLFGGWTSPCVYPLHQQGILYDELHVYSVTHNMWTQFYFSQSPPPTAGHTATVHGDIVVCFGGLQKRSDTSTSTNDIYCLDMNNSTWFKPIVSQTVPSPRYGHSQTKITERRIMIMSGCGGYNNLHNDVWLLTIPENNLESEIWCWKQVVVDGFQFMPKQIWCNPVCKVGNNLVLLSRKNEPQSEGLISNPQFFRAGKPIAQQWTPPRANNVNNNAQNVLERSIEEDEYRLLAANAAMMASGQKQPFNNSPLRPTSSSHHGQPPSPDNSGAVSQLRPSVRPNASSNRERRLSMLSKYEDRLKALSRDQARAAQAAARVRDQKPTCVQVVYLLDLSTILTTGSVCWRPGPSWCGGTTAPHPRFHSTLLLGRGELVLCGGKKTGECKCSAADTLPPIAFITAPGTVM